ncbi:hypothetical protein NDU88_001069 [Pleurodeles waltl]|uniref:Uncharacterized protein n=1 Tax=Pleurodeles waltl TaxID=8319 RepID=A0AAV7U6H9_PLEWA|nr:hypothetical protein NDU88_001069 [Pleurodeles waltl]
MGAGRAFGLLGLSAHVRAVQPVRMRQAVSFSLGILELEESLKCWHMVGSLDSPTPVESSTSSSERISWCLEDPLAPSDSCGVAARAVQEQCSGVLENPLTISGSCGSVARAVPSVLAGGAC